MRKIIYILLILSLKSCIIYAQKNDSVNLVKYDFNFRYKDGIYLDFNAFKTNNPLVFSSLIYPQYTGLDFNRVLDTVSHISFIDNYGLLQNIFIKNVWGYSHKGRVYIMYSDKFNLLSYIGRISHFVTKIQVTHSSYVDPFYSNYYMYDPVPRSYKTEELRQFIIDMDNSIILSYNLENVSDILKRSDVLYQDFSKLSKRKKNKQLFYYIRLYNELNNLYVPE